MTRRKTLKIDLLRTYITKVETEENYVCTIAEAATATAAAPVYFKHVTFKARGEQWVDGGLRANNPIREALDEASREHTLKDKPLACVVSIGTGAPSIEGVASSLPRFLRQCVKIMTNSEDVARSFERGLQGQDLLNHSRYFRFNVPQGMESLKLDDFSALEKMRGLTNHYLGGARAGNDVGCCAASLLHQPAATSNASPPGNQSTLA